MYRKLNSLFTISPSNTSLKQPNNETSLANNFPTTFHRFFFANINNSYNKERKKKKRNRVTKQKQNHAFSSWLFVKVKVKNNVYFSLPLLPAKFEPRFSIENSPLIQVQQRLNQVTLEKLHNHLSLTVLKLFSPLLFPFFPFSSFPRIVQRSTIVHAGRA